MSITLVQIHDALYSRLASQITDVTIAPGLKEPGSSTGIVFDLNLRVDRNLNSRHSGCWIGDVVFRCYADLARDCAALADRVMAALEVTGGWDEGDVTGLMSGQPTTYQSMTDAPNDGTDDAGRWAVLTFPMIFKEA